MKLILIQSPNNERVCHNQLSFVIKQSFPYRDWVISNGVVVQRSTMEIYKTIHAVAQIISCSPQIDPKFLLLKTKPTQFIDHEEFELVSTQSLHSSLCSGVFATGLYSAHYQEKCQHPPNYKPFDLQCCTAWKICQVEQNLWE